MNVEHRLRKLEASDSNRHWDSVVTLIVEEHESKEEVIRRHFGEEGQPDGSLVILHTIVSPVTKPDSERGLG